MRSMDYAESLANDAHEYESLKESVHLLRSPLNARGLLDAIDRLESRHEPHE